MAATSAEPLPASTGAKRLTFPSYLGYAAGDAGNNLAFSMASMFLLLYYTDVVGIPAAYAAPIFLIIRIWDGIGDVIIGRFVDRTNSRWGKFRPWILFSSLPLLLSSVWVFTQPQVDSLTMKLFWAYLSYGVLAMVYSCVNIPYGSLAATMTQLPTERAKLATARSLGAAITGLALALVVAPQVNRWSANNVFNDLVADAGGESALSQGQVDALQAQAQVEAASGLQGALTTITLIFVFVGFALYLLTFFTAKEQVIRPAQDKTTFGQAMHTLWQNKPLMVLCAGSLLALTATIAFQTMGIYYARDVLGNANLFPVLSITQTAAIFVLAPFIGKLVERFGKLATYLGAGVAFIAGAVVLFLTPAGSVWLAILGYFLIGAGIGLSNTLMWAMEADTVEYGEWKTGRRTEGTTYAVFSFVRKLGQAFGGFAAAGVIGLTGYVGSAAVQTDEALQGIRIATGLVPAVLVLLAVLLMTRYPLPDKRFKEIVAETEARKAAERAELA